MTLHDRWVDDCIAQQCPVFLHEVSSGSDTYEQGILCAHSADWMGYKEFDRAGRYSGYCLIRKSKIVSLSRAGVYHQELATSWSEGGILPDQSGIPFPLLGSLPVVLEFLKQSERLACFVDEDDVDIHGFVLSFDDNSVELKAHTADSVFDAYILLPVDRIGLVEFHGPRLRLLEEAIQGKQIDA